MSYSETFAALWRKQNQSILSASAFSTAQAALGNEVLGDPDSVVLPKAARKACNFAANTARAAAMRAPCDPDVRRIVTRQASTDLSPSPVSVPRHACGRR